MKKANVAELKNRLSHYLRFVRAGHAVLVYDRDRAIARIEPVSDVDDAEPGAWIADLERSGVVRRPTAKLPARWLEQRPRTKADVVGALRQERDGGR